MEAILAPQDVQANFRHVSQQLLARGVDPREVQWRPEPGAGPVQVGAPPQRRAAAGHGLIPRSFLRIVDLVVLHCDAGRFALLYRLLWRMVHEPGFAQNNEDAEMKLACAMAHAVRREISRHKQRLAFVPVRQGGGELACAWVAPHHHIVEVLANTSTQPRCLLASPERAVLREDGCCTAYAVHWTEPAGEADWRERLDALGLGRELQAG